MPGELEEELSISASVEHCRSAVGISGVLAALLALSTIIVSLALMIFEAHHPSPENYFIKYEFEPLKTLKKFIP